jgi:nitrate reductase alpha subunit
VPDRLLRASDFAGRPRRDQQSRMEDRRDRRHHRQACRRRRGPPVSAGASRANGTSRRRTAGAPVKLRMTAILDEDHDAVVDVAFPYFGNREHDHFEGTDHLSVLNRACRSRDQAGKDGEALVATVFDLLCANYGLDRGLGGENVATRLRRRRALHAGLGREDHRRSARPDHHGRPRIRRNAEKTNGVDGDPRGRA